MAKQGAVGAVIAAVLVFGAVGACQDDEPELSGSANPASSLAAPVAVPQVPTVPVAPAVPPAPAVAPASQSVLRVIDGDTFELASGDEVRVLGIDSCEMSTYGGRQAKQSAESWLGSGQQVTLTREPGVDRDRYGRLLRYVDVSGTGSGGDFGELMVTADHTGVYEGENDASANYVAELESMDYSGRTCEDPAEQYVVSDDEDDDDQRRSWTTGSDDSGPSDYSGSSSSDDDSSSSSGGSTGHTGDSGHPCLPGERDGDGDGWCGES